jgi:hypothetical protein
MQIGADFSSLLTCTGAAAFRGDVCSLHSSERASGGVRLPLFTRPHVPAPHLPNVVTAHNQRIPVPSPFAQASVRSTLTLHKERTRTNKNCETGSPNDRPPPSKKGAPACTPSTIFTSPSTCLRPIAPLTPPISRGANSQLVAVLLESLAHPLLRPYLLHRALA